MSKQAGPRFISFFGPTLDALRALGSSAKPKEVFAWISENHPVSRSELEATNKGGQSKFENQVSWARFYLTKGGFLDTEQRGVWVLTPKGREARLTHEQSLSLFREIHDKFQQHVNPKEKDQAHLPELEESDTTAPDERTFLNQDEIQEQLVQILKSLTDKGFEELCARLLRHIGFEDVTVTGKAGDRGVDGEGHLIINRFFRTKVMFQCKRYDKVVGPDKIRDFRGAIQGRAERGILLTTGTFTRGAVEEAARENATAIELVDIDRLIALLVEENLGIQETRALAIQRDFFRPYQPA
jgi:restriction system protein